MSVYKFVNIVVLGDEKKWSPELLKEQTVQENLLCDCRMNEDVCDSDVNRLRFMGWLRSVYWDWKRKDTTATMFEPNKQYR